MTVASRNTTEKYGVVSASKIIGEAVVNRQNENLGKIHELVIDAKEGRLVYAVLSFGGFMGMGNKLFALPWRTLEFSATENKLILNVDKEKLKAAPGFDQNAKWPDFADRTWGNSIYNYYGYNPYWKPQGRRFGRSLISMTPGSANALPSLKVTKSGEGTQWKSDIFVLDPEMIEDTVQIVNEAIKDKIQVNLIINNRAGGNAPLIVQKIPGRLHKERQQRLF